MSHTKTPWKIERHVSNLYITASDRYESVVCEMRMHPEAMANAEKIVAAVNASVKKPKKKPKVKS